MFMTGVLCAVRGAQVYFYYIYNGIIFPSLNPAKIFQFIFR